MRRAVPALVGIAALAATVVAPPRPRLVWNVSPSAPTGLYRVRSGGRAAPGDIVIARVPAPWRRLAAERHYIPINVPLVKRVAAAEGDRICAVGRRIFVNGRPAAERRAFDGHGRPMPGWRGCITLGKGALLLLTDAPDSFDGRYFGPTGAADIIGRARLIWAR
jgi:conjugative transfer signal peptidase TraF